MLPIRKAARSAAKVTSVWQGFYALSFLYGYQSNVFIDTLINV